jgi:hypothetical protein
MTTIDAMDGTQNQDFLCDGVQYFRPAYARRCRERDISEHLCIAQNGTKYRAKQELLAEERLEHRACQEGLRFKRERREETDNLAGRLLQFLARAGRITDNLRIQLRQAKGVGVPSFFDS